MQQEYGVSKGGGEASCARNVLPRIFLPVLVECIMKADADQMQTF